MLTLSWKADECKPLMDGEGERVSENLAGLPMAKTFPKKHESMILRLTLEVEDRDKALVGPARNCSNCRFRESNSVLGLVWKPWHRTPCDQLEPSILGNPQTDSPKVRPRRHP
jgi:hypothetical protein